ncbi:unnamed protein product [Prorocentrum cordatum]|uniref:Uncharacterized protein n=1 Tax=Prorocentrum cordatum TaxID=2364126 RepID=A0ABN9TZL4_9DINO|nr:unnamed protein product [Polarella glacialis]
MNRRSRSRMPGLRQIGSELVAERFLSFAPMSFVREVQYNTCCCNIVQVGMDIGEALPRRNVIFLVGAQLGSKSGLTEYTFGAGHFLVHSARLQEWAVFEFQA